MIIHHFNNLSRISLLRIPFITSFYKIFRYQMHFLVSSVLAINKSNIFSFKVYIPHSSVCKESTCNAGDPSWIPGSGRPGGEGIGYPLQYSWASLVAQLVKNLPVVQEVWV